MKKNSAAFTLIEVLVALLIIAIALAAAIRATTSSVRVTTHVRNSMAAHWVGLNILSEVQVGLVQLPDSDNKLFGKTTMMQQTWQWEVVVDKSLQLPDIKRVTVTVSLHNHPIRSVVGYVK